MIATKRLILRRWTDADRAQFHAMSNDPAVMEFLGPVQSATETDAAIDRLNAHLDDQGYTFWALERRADGAFLGFTGLKPGPAGTPLFGKVEIGWRLASEFQGQGYALEAASASLDWGWTNLSEDEILAMTVAANVRSWGLMERLGFSRRPELDFGHPALPTHSALRQHIVYSIARPL
jgi:RimJ/RimL family protein N-acetyltransferase